MTPDVMARLPVGARVRHIKSHISYTVIRVTKAGLPIFRAWHGRGPEMRLNPANVEFDEGYDAEAAATVLAAEKEKALQDVVDLIWPPSYHLTEDGDQSLRQQSEVLSAIMDRLAFLRPQMGGE